MRFQRCDRGATAIEYAIIAGLIGLGLIGSLVTTRGSLSAVFGTASSKMASADTSAASAPTSNSPRSSYWATKTLAGAPVTTNYGGGQSAVAFTYTDGSTVTLALGRTDPYATGVYINDTAAMLKTQTLVGSNGVLTQYEHRVFASSTLASNTQTSLEYADSSMISNGVVGSTQQYSCNGGSCTNLGIGSPTAGFSAKATTGLQDLRYFLDIKP